MPRIKLSNAIVLDYLRKIGSAEMEPGSPLPTEATLCETYQVGRSVVREALQALDAKGFIIVRQGAVAVVAPRYRWHVLDDDFLTVNSGAEFFEYLQEAREALEPYVAAIAATRMTPDVLGELTELNAKLSVVGASPEEHAELDIAFHDLIARTSQNPILISWHSSITSLGHRTRAASAAVEGAVDRAVGWHERVVDAFRSGDGAAVSAAMLLHLKQVRADLARVGQVQPLNGPESQEEHRDCRTESEWGGSA
jgi:GntR family transcriptional repressor for pyruvate dehydrogenase complex/GntR family galactonate operon transcriptional repressor